MSGFHGAFATGVACQQETLTLPNTWFRPPFWGLACAPDSSNLPCLYSIFHLEYPLVLSRFCFPADCPAVDMSCPSKCLVLDVLSGCTMCTCGTENSTPQTTSPATKGNMTSPGKVCACIVFCRVQL